MITIKVDLPSVHMAGSDAHHDAHIRVGQHGFALFLAPDADLPVLDITGTPAQLGDVVTALAAALRTRQEEAAPADATLQLELLSP
jgi:hypothetical protein